MVKRSIRRWAASALFTMTLASGTAQAFAQQQGGIVYQQQAYEAPGYCHIKYKAFTRESLQTGQLEFDDDNLIDRYGACDFDPSSPEEVRNQMAIMTRSLFRDSDSQSE
jgi:hypothetical protein